MCNIYCTHNDASDKDPTLAAETKTKIHSSLEILDKQLATTDYIYMMNYVWPNIPIGC